MKIVLNYDQYCNITDNNGTLIHPHPGLEDHALVEKEELMLTVKEVLQLKEAGFESGEIIAMRKAGVL